MSSNVRASLRKSNGVQNIYIFAYVLYIVQRLTNNTTLNNIVPFIAYRSIKVLVIILLILFALCHLKFKIRSFIWSLAIIAFSVIATYMSRDLNLICIALFIVESQYVQFEKLVKANLFTIAFVLITVICLSVVGLLPNYEYSHYSIVFNSRIPAHAFGFNHYSTPSFIVFFVSIAILSYRRNVLSYLLVLGFNFFAYIYLTTKLTLILIVLFLIMTTFLERKKLFSRSGRKLSLALSFIPLCLLILTFIFSVAYSPDNAFLERINQSLSDRIRLGQIGLQRFGVSLFGQNFNMVGVFTQGVNSIDEASYIYIDSDYLYLPMRYGLLLTTVIISIYAVLIRRLVEENSYYYFSWTIAALVFALVNWCLILIELNPIILAGLRIINNEWLGSNNNLDPNCRRKRGNLMEADR